MEILENFGVNPVLLAAQIVNFIIVLFILKKFLYKPILDLLKKRQFTIKEGLKQAEATAKEAAAKAAEVNKEPEPSIQPDVTSEPPGEPPPPLCVSQVIVPPVFHTGTCKLLGASDESTPSKSVLAVFLPPVFKRLRPVIRRLGREVGWHSCPLKPTKARGRLRTAKVSVIPLGIPEANLIFVCLIY